jgi:hypothetical protein
MDVVGLERTHSVQLVCLQRLNHLKPRVSREKEASSETANPAACRRRFSLFKLVDKCRFFGVLQVMGRPMRREFAGAIYDGPNLGNRREKIFRLGLKWAAGSLAMGRWAKARISLKSEN